MSLPCHWLDCPPHSSIIGDRFIACKTPLDHRYGHMIKESQRWTCQMLTDHVKHLNQNLKLVINLESTEFYDSKVEFEENNILYHNIPLSTGDAMPSNEQLQRFVKICKDFILQHPYGIIAVHCLYGFNGTGFLICTFLCRELHMTIESAISHFAERRKPGIYEQHYLDTLIERLGDRTSTRILKPALPHWCLTSSASGENKRFYSNDASNQSAKRCCQVSPISFTPRDAIRLPEMVPVVAETLLNTIKQKYRCLCKWPRRGFPGCHPVSMHGGNYEIILKSPYMVTWKPAGKRYMMLIEGEDTVYMLDQGDKLLTVAHIRFPRDMECRNHLKNTLVDGELVIDCVDGSNKPSFLINDIIIYNDEDVSKKPLPYRLKLISESIIDIRDKAIEKGHIDQTAQPFSVRKKEFFDLLALDRLLSPEFLATLPHEVEGFIFSPKQEPYRSGLCEDLLKWKENETMDFQMKISSNNLKKCQLFLNGTKSPYATMRYSPHLQQYDNKIISCLYKDNQWCFHRLRDDRPFPNSQKTAKGIEYALQRPITREALLNLTSRMRL